MKRYALIIFGFVVLFSAMFGLAEWLQISWLVDPAASLQHDKWLAAAGGSALLVLDIVLPVPASIIMGLNGKLFGVPLGTLVSLCGTMAAATIGFSIGRAGGPLLDRVVKPEERRQAEQLVQKWGALAIIVMRPVPMLAETVTILAGTSGMSWRTFLISAFVGSVPMCYLFALAGEQASIALMFGAVLALAFVFWLAGRILVRLSEGGDEGGGGDGGSDISTAPE
jgi:uncharacterized membrane protein YdjX (TVP38/TMEM64 family)